MPKENKDILKLKINEILERIRPYLIADGGDVEFIELTNDNHVKVRLIGACGNCPFNEHTLKAGIEQSLQQELPNIKSVIAV
jgi:Fe-S cluster biogenesis protein NfuA